MKWQMGALEDRTFADGEMTTAVVALMDAKSLHPLGISFSDVLAGLVQQTDPLPFRLALRLRASLAVRPEMRFEVSECRPF